MDPTTRPTILSLGSINADLQFALAGPFDTGGTLRSESFTRRAGGKAANVAYFTHRLGVPTKLLGRVGDDDFATIALKPLSDAGLDLDHVIVASHTLTGVTAIAAPPDGNKSILSAPNANDSWSEESIESIASTIEHAPEGSILVADFEIPASVLDAVFRAAEKRGFRILVDPTFADRMEKSRLDRFHAATPNQKEAAQLLAMDVPDASAAERAARKLNALGVEIACVKLSTGGCVLAHERRPMLVRAPAGDVVDKTGAGDAFLAALAVALLEGKSACEAACWGVAASTISVAASGAQESYPTRHELDQMIAAVLRLNDAG